MSDLGHEEAEGLLDYAYGELSTREAEAFEAHLKACAECTQELASVRGVRKTMARLEVEPAPVAGLESLQAYAEQAARRMEGVRAQTSKRPWKTRWVAPLTGAVALVVVAGVAVQVTRETPSLQQRVEEATIEPQPTIAKFAPVPPAPAPAREMAATQAEEGPEREEKAAQVPMKMRAKSRGEGSAGSNEPSDDLDGRRAAELGKGVAGSTGFGEGAGGRSGSGSEAAGADPRFAQRPGLEAAPDHPTRSKESLGGAGANTGNKKSVEGVGGALNRRQDEASAVRAPAAKPPSQPESTLKAESVEDRAGAASEVEGDSESSAALDSRRFAPPPPPPMPPASVAAAQPAPALSDRAPPPQAPAAAPKRSVSRPSAPAAATSAAPSAPSAAREMAQPAGAEEARTVDLRAAGSGTEARRRILAQRIETLRKTLSSGPRGVVLESVLADLCDAEWELGLPEARARCLRLVREFPQSPKAPAVRQRLQGE